MLGVNGAGKSTTFKNLTNELAPTSGSITVKGFDVQGEFKKARKFIGYCPQQNLIFETMSVYESIYYFTMIKGVPFKHIKNVVNTTIEQLDLEKYRNTPTGKLSGGN